ncbi:MAG TPA: hypothetical protein VIL69_13560 [Roseomonas sp.]|jgi:hypothetical protein
MTADDPDAAAALIPVTAEEIAAAPAHALRFDARGKARHGVGDLVTSLVAERLVDHLQQSGFVLMRGRGARPHAAG